MIPAAAIPVLYRWGAILAIGLALLGFGWLQGSHHEQIKAERFEAATKALGDAQVAHTKAVEAQQQDNLKQVTHDLLLNVQAAGDVAVGNYRARYPDRVQQCPGSGAVSQPATGQPGNDGAGGERLAAETCRPDEAFIKSSGRDAARLEAWREYATLNHIPVQP